MPDPRQGGTRSSQPQSSLNPSHALNPSRTQILFPLPILALTQTEKDVPPHTATRTHRHTPARDDVARYVPLIALLLDTQQ
jgi:hypothetical protein